MTMTEEQWNEENAAEIVHIMYDPETFEFMHIGITDMNATIAQELDRNLARAVAYRLLQLADNAPAPQVVLPPRTVAADAKPLRRLAIVDEQLRRLEP